MNWPRSSLIASLRPLSGFRAANVWSSTTRCTSRDAQVAIKAHELAHIILDHDVCTIERVGNLKFLTCDVQQEEEADWLGGCLLLPRVVLLKAAWTGHES
jgi:hypothetical protein